MKWPKHFAAVVSNSGLRFLLFFGITVACLAYLLTSPKTIKTAIVDTNGYQRFTSAVVDEAQKAYKQESGIGFGDPQIKSIVNETFSEKVLRPSAESAIDGVYSWLDGTTETPKFEVNLTEPKSQLADKLSAYAFVRLAAQPTCFAIPANLDPLTAGCKPPYTDLNAEQLKFKELLANNQSFLANPVINEKNLPKNSDGKLIYEQYYYAPKVYKWLKWTPWIVAAICSVLAIGLIFFSHSKRKGISQVGWALLSTGFALLVTPILFGYVLPKISGSLSFKVSGGGNAVQQVFSDVVARLTNDFYNLMINVSIQLMLLGSVIVGAEKFTRIKSPYASVSQRSGLISSNTVRNRSNPSKRTYSPDSIPIQSSEQSKRRLPSKTINKKYRKIP